MSKQEKQPWTRREFLKAAGALGTFTAAAPLVTESWQAALRNLWGEDPHGVGNTFLDYSASDVIYTTCEQCNTHCTIKAVVQGVPAAVADAPFASLVRKIAGNPYSPLNMQPFGQIAYDTSPEQAARGGGDVAKEGRGWRGGRTCLKGQAGIQTAYDALRVRTPLKRVGPRGSGRWVSISWEQALREIIEGSPDLGTPGLRSIWAFVPKEPVMADWDKVQRGEMTQEAFDAKYRDVLIDTRHPDLGPRANQIVGVGGNRREFMRERVWFQGLGSINFYDHGGICGVSSVVGNVRSFSGKKPKRRMYADLEHVQFLIAWGTNPVVANKGPTWLAPQITNAIQRGMKLAVVDPRLSKTAEKAHIWVPVRPGADAALALAMGRWIIEHKRYDERYLRNPNKKAATADNEPTWSDATHLVNVSDPNRQKLRASDLGLGGKDQFVVLENGLPVPHDQAASGDLEVDATINGIHVKSAFALYKERVMEQSLEEYANLCGVDVAVIERLADEFTSHGKRAAIITYRGPAMHTNGYYAMRAINCLNHLIGNHDWKGGDLTSGANFGELSGRYDVLKVPNGHKPWGVPLARTQTRYEDTSLSKRDGYPAKRPWFPYAGNLVQEVLPSAKEAYPYPIQALFMYRLSPVASAPGGALQAQILRDAKAVPLLVALDVAIGESSMYADFILPDLTYLERWGLETIYPNLKQRLSDIMQPVTRVFPEPRAVEDVFIDLLQRMKLPGAGDNAFIDGRPLRRAEDFYLKVVANIAYHDTPVPDAPAEEQRFFVEARKKALGKAFDLDAWRRAVKPEEWPKVVYVLNRGGRFEAGGDEYRGEHLKYQWGQQANFYDETVAKGKHSYTGQPFDGLPRVEPVTAFNGEPVSDDLPLQLINWKARHIGTHRNVSSAWLREVQPSNPLWMNPADAAARGLKTGDRVRIRSRHFEVTGQVLVTQGIRPGVVGADYNFGHYAYGSQPVEIDGKRVGPVRPYGHTPFDFFQPMREDAGLAKGRGTGFSVNHLQRLDETIKGSGCLSDPIGGSASQLDTRVEVVKL